MTRVMFPVLLRTFFANFRLTERTQMIDRFEHAELADREAAYLPDADGYARRQIPRP